MMNVDAIDQAARTLLDAWRAGTVLDALPPAVRPTDEGDGFAIQRAIERLSGSRRVGWKIAATSPAGQQHIGVPGPLPGTLLASQVQTGAGTFPLGRNRMRVAEAEFAFRIGRDLPARTQPWSRDEVLAAVASLHPAIEVPDSRYAQFVTAGGAQLIADNACADTFVLGPATDADWRTLDLATHTVEVRYADGRRVPGIGSNVLGDPRDALTWVANRLAALGPGLSAGEVVTTGTCIVPCAIAPGDAIVADFGVLGRVEARFTD
jgi:2-keto-4-pentenoate hydratase